MVHIRALSPSDAESYWKLRLEALEGEPTSFGSSGEEIRVEGFASVTTRVLRSVPEGDFLLGAFEADRLIGMVGFVRSKRLKDRHLGQVVAMYVTPTFRRHGVGRRLLVALIERVRDTGEVRRMNLSVAVDAPATGARKLYRSLGFLGYGIEPDALKLGDRFVDMELMSLLLPPDGTPGQ